MNPKSRIQNLHPESFRGRESSGSRPSSPGFTIVEVLAIIAIICALAALTIGVARMAREKAKSSRTRAEMAAIENALERFKNDNGFYPAGDNSITSSISLYESLVVGPKKYLTFHDNQLQTNTTYSSFVILDIFGRPYYYQYPGASNPASFDLWSAGSDKFSNTVDDITNWKQQ